MIEKATHSVLTINQLLECGTKKGTGDNQPPKNKSETMAESHNILLYSAKKNKAKVIEEYSTLYPATISASASGKSKGALLVSAKTEIKKMTKTGRSGKIYHVPMPCLTTISIILKLFAQAAIGSSSKAIETSYEINCAAERKPPRKAYLLLLAHPAPIIPYTPNEEKA